MKRLLIFLLCSVMAFSSLSIAAGAAEMELIEEAADADITEEAAGVEITEEAAGVEITDEAADTDSAEVGANADDIASTGWSLLSEAQFQNKLSSLRSKYPNGSIWEGVYYEGGYARAWTCWAYAAQMMKEVFGANFYGDGLLNYKYYDPDNVNAGDWVRIDYDSHSVFITKVTGNGIYYTDGNGTGVYNQVRWDGYFSWSQFYNRFSYGIKLPGNNLKGTAVSHTVAYNANGGSGSVSSQSYVTNEVFTLKSNNFYRSGYTFAGYTVKRSSDNKWFTSNGWQSESDVNRYGYSYSIYQPGESYMMSSNWLNDTSSSTTLTFYAQWSPNNTVAYNANGGTGSMDSQKYGANEVFTLKANGFSRSGYTFAGYIVKRSTDNKWFTSGGNGWQSQSDIYNNGYDYSVYQPGESYRMSTNWLEDLDYTTTLTFYAQWLPNKTTLEFAANYSGYNYMLGSDLGSNYSNYIYSRSSAYSVSVDSSEKLNSVSSLKITGSSAGSTGTDLAFVTSTNLGYGGDLNTAAPAGDDKTFYLHFYAKASVDGAKMVFRWGYSDKLISVSLSKNWQTYSVALPKTRYYGYALHPYFDKAGTYYINSLAMGDIEGTGNVVPETGTWAASPITVNRGEAPDYLPTPTRSGYVFSGWFTAAEGGTRITADTPIYESTLRLYAHWRKDISYTPIKTKKYQGHIYELYDNVLSWEEASAFCERKGGHLVTIGSAQENNTVFGMIEGRQGYCWLGLKCQTPPSGWKWVDNTSLSSYNKWYNSSYGTTDSKEYYAMMYPINYGTTPYASTWNKCKGSNYYCSYYGYYNSFFICEYDDPAYLGDTDGNGEVDVIDATLIQRESAGLSANIPERSRMRGDVDGNGRLEIIDVAYIQRYLAGIETPYKIGEWIH